METYKKNLIIIHGAGPKHYRSLADGSGDWQTELTTHLANDFRILTPQMPSPKQPIYEEWKILLEKNIARLKTDEVTFIGHSLGGSFLVKYLAEEKLEMKVSGLFLVAAPIKTMKGFEAPADLSLVKEINPIQIYHSMDDVEVPYAHSLILQNKLGAKLHTFSDRGHYFKKAAFPEIAKDLKSSISITTFPEIANTP